MERVLEAEWLDTLAPEDRRARRSRADLVRINFVLGSARHIARALAGRRLARIADLGAGDAAFTLSLARRLASAGVEMTVVDPQLALSDETLSSFRRMGWRIRLQRQDAEACLQERGPRYDAIVANLFLHHLDDAALERLFARVAQRTSLFVACEPRRARLPLLASHLVALLGCNAVTRHDAVASVRAGFRGAELTALWPARRGWQLVERPASAISHFFLAVRDA